MNSYVVAYPVPFFRRDTPECVLIEKVKPKWQAGMWNLVGGSIEPTDSSVIEAAIRELEEETGIKCSRRDARLSGRIEGPGYEVFVVTCPYHGAQTPVSQTKERVFTADINDAVQSPRLIPNLKLVLPLLRSGVDDWRVIGTENDTCETEWRVKFDER